MSLRIIYGSSGCGKSEYIFTRVSEMAAQMPKQRFFVVVPEQFTLQAQKSLVAHAKNGVILNVDVVSFERLAYRVFDELGIHQTIMEETGKSLVLRRLAARVEQELTVLKGSIRKMGYIGELKSVLSEFMQYGISVSELEQVLETLDPKSNLYFKLTDILKVYRSFEDYLKDQYVTAERVLEVLMEHAESSALLKNAVFVFDGFTGFTPVQMKLMHRLMHLASNLYVTVTMDIREPLYEAVPMTNLFYMSKKMVLSLLQAARMEGVEIGKPIVITGDEAVTASFPEMEVVVNPRFRLSDQPVLHALEQNLFRPLAKSSELSCEGALGLYSLSTPRAELRFAAEEISRLLREQNLHYGDFAIVCGDVEGYEKYAREIFEQYEIPYFMDLKQEILYHPLIELVRAALELVETNYSYESVFRYLRTELTGFAREDIDLLDNYCLAKGVRGASRWQKKFLTPMRAPGRVQISEEVIQEELRRVNALRERFWKQTKTLYLAFTDAEANVRTRTEALYQFLCSLGVEEQLRVKEKQFEEQQEQVLASEYRQIYKILIDLLDKMADLLGTEYLPVQEYSDVLEAGLAAAKVGSIPPGRDRVILGDIERSRLDGIQVLFFVGVNDGLIPKNTSGGSILSQFDREILENREMELAPTAREQSFLQRFYLYLNLTRPSKRLYVTFARLNAEGKALRPSYLVGALQHLFSALQVEVVDETRGDLIFSPKEALDPYLKGLIKARQGEVLPEWKALHHWYQKQPEWKDTVEALFEAAWYCFQGEFLEADVASVLYGTVLSSSVTRLEQYARCAFSHFLSYGLKLSERELYGFEALDMGSMFHAILQNYSIRVDRDYDWNTITQEESDQLLEASMEEVKLTMPNEALLESARSAYVLERIYRIMRRSIWALTEQIRHGNFRPMGYEVEFVQTAELSEEHFMRTVGKIDRVDLCEKDSRLFVKVVDYKSGAASFQLFNLFYGRQLQLVLYLNAATALLQEKYPEKEIVPAGIFYFHLDDPMVEEDGMSEEQIRQEILEKLRPNGLVSADPEVYGQMDPGLSGKSSVIPLKLNKDGSIGKIGSSVAGTEEFALLQSFVTEKMKETAGEILGGGIGVFPYELNGRTGCDYCSYRSVCGFDGRIPGFRYKKEHQLENEEIWRKMEEQEKRKERR